MTTRLQVRRDTAANWTSNNPTLYAGEIGYETDTGAMKIGNGSTAWTSLSYAPTRFQARNYTAANWTSLNPTLAVGEFGFETDTGQFKIGTGSTAWNSLAYYPPTPVQVRRDTAANWTTNNTTLAVGEFGYETDTGAVKIGDGSTAWTSLNYVGDTFHYQYTSAGSALGPSIADYFPSPSSPNLLANSTYDIEAKLYFLKTTSGTVTWTWLASSAPSMIFSEYIGTAVTGFTTTGTTTAPITGAAAIQSNTTLAHAATAALTTAVYHVHTIRAHVRTNAATNLRLRVTSSSGTVTPQAGSYLSAKLIYPHGSSAS